MTSCGSAAGSFLSLGRTSPVEMERGTHQVGLTIMWVISSENSGVWSFGSDLPTTTRVSNTDFPCLTIEARKSGRLTRTCCSPNGKFIQRARSSAASTWRILSSGSTLIALTVSRSASPSGSSPCSAWNLLTANIRASLYSADAEFLRYPIRIKRLRRLTTDSPELPGTSSVASSLRPHPPSAAIASSRLSVLRSPA